MLIDFLLSDVQRTGPSEMPLGLDSFFAHELSADFFVNFREEETNQELDHEDTVAFGPGRSQQQPRLPPPYCLFSVSNHMRPPHFGHDHNFTTAGSSAFICWQDRQIP